MRIGRALDHRDDAHEDALVRLRLGDRQILDLQARRPATPTRRWSASAARG